MGLTLGYFLMQMQEMGIKVDKKKNKVWSTGKADIGGEWELTTTNGTKFGSKDLAGSYYLIYFGFCNCPDICPNSLHKLSKALQKLRAGPDRHIQLKTIFVSVDPDRDSPERITKFLSFFNKEFIGVTASSNDDPKLRDMMQKFKIYASKIEYEEEEKGRKMYTMDHTILTYLMDENNQFLAYLGSNMSETDLHS